MYTENTKRGLGGSKPRSRVIYPANTTPESKLRAAARAGAHRKHNRTHSTIKQNADKMTVVFTAACSSVLCNYALSNNSRARQGRRSQLFCSKSGNDRDIVCRLTRAALISDSKRYKRPANTRAWQQQRRRSFPTFSDGSDFSYLFSSIPTPFRVQPC